MNYQWYPGHMTKAKRMMQEDIKLIDLIIELVDARIPLSSRNPDIDELGKNKSRIVLLNKSDLADARYNSRWAEYFRKKGFFVLEINAKTGAGMKAIYGLVQEACREKIERDRRRGILNRPVRAMVVGIPNVGKSTFINSFAKKACTKTGNKPGVTKGKQWIRLDKSLELLDTPGILWPKFEDQNVGMKLAFIGSMNDEIIIMQEMALDLIAVIAREYPGAFSDRYGIKAEVTEDTEVTAAAEGTDTAEEKAAAWGRAALKPSLQILTEIAKVRKCYGKGEEIDYDKAASLFVDDFRSGRLGRITLEFPTEE